MSLSQRVAELPADHPILSTLPSALEGARHVSLDLDRLVDVAGWMACEELPFPSGPSPLLPECSPAEAADFLFVAASINFAFTDFETRQVFALRDSGKTHYDSDAMMICLRRACEEGKPILKGSYLAGLERGQLAEIFSGDRPIPLLDERLAVLRENGRILAEKHGGRFHRFVEAGPPRLYAGEEGLMKRLVGAFPSYRDTSAHRGGEVVFHKRAQLLWWLLVVMTGPGRFVAIEDLERLTAFADYILPAALRTLGVFRYAPELEEAIERGRIIPADSEEEVEIRAFTLFACHLLTEEINKRRPADRQIIPAIVDYRLWSHYHAGPIRHHLTKTTDY